MNAQTREEEEQLEALKRWWSEYRVAIIGGLVIGFGVLFGGRAWIGYQNSLATSASAEYEQLRVELRQQNSDAVLKRGDHIIETYSGTPYAAFAALAIAKRKVDQGELDEARTRLQWVIDNSGEEEFVHVARLRLARVLLAADSAEQALTLIDKVKPGAFAASYAEVRGDVYAALDRPEEARAAYRRALEDLDSESGARLVRMKLDELGRAGG